MYAQVLRQVPSTKRTVSIGTQPSLGKDRVKYVAPKLLRIPQRAASNLCSPEPKYTKPRYAASSEATATTTLSLLY